MTQKSPWRTMCKGKIHRATVTEANLNYIGSITLDPLLMQAANILPYEMVQITNLRNAVRWKTYAIPANEGSGKVCLNGPPAHLFIKGDMVIILSLGIYASDECMAITPQVVFVNEKNEIVKIEKHNLLTNGE